jgi:hypothetical protein
LTARAADEVDTFVKEHDGKHNLYYSTNPTRAAMTKKAAKADIAAVEYLLADLDPADGETPEAAKARYLDQLNNAFVPKPTAIVDSGNGIQCLWRLSEPIALPPDNAEATIADVEARTAAIMLRLGAKAGTQNVDRILRLPGTTNLPNAKKQKEGRVKCPARLISFDDTSYPLTAFPLPDADNRRAEPSRPGTPDDGGHHARQDTDKDELLWTIHHAEIPVGKRSERVWWVINEMLRRGYRPEAITATLLDRNNKISAHIYDQKSGPRAYAERQVKEAVEKITLAADDKDIPFKTTANIRIALLKLRIVLRYDQFADRVLLVGLAEFGPTLDDAALDRIWLTMSERLRLPVSKDLLRTVVLDVARLNGFHPVCDYLDGLQWDSKPRIDAWLTTYGGAEDNEYARAVGALMLTAAVRRVRRPGCKFDEMVVLENEQGTNKSTALAALAVQEAWFSDDLPLNIEGKRVIESLRGRWIIEAAELSGMRRADIEHLKAFLSRQVDRARMAYGHIVSEVPRQCIIVGTTNAEEYLRDTTGNRRFWPVRCKQFDITALRRDRDQLWATQPQPPRLRTRRMRTRATRPTDSTTPRRRGGGGTAPTARSRSSASPETIARTRTWLATSTTPTRGASKRKRGDAMNTNIPLTRWWERIEARERYCAEQQQRMVQQMVALQRERQERENRERVAAWEAQQARERAEKVRAAEEHEQIRREMAERRARETAEREAAEREAAERAHEPPIGMPMGWRPPALR